MATRPEQDYLRPSGVRNLWRSNAELELGDPRDRTNAELELGGPRGPKMGAGGRSSAENNPGQFGITTTGTGSGRSPDVPVLQSGRT